IVQGMRFVSWLPHHHDAGLIWGLTMPLLLGCEGISLRPKAFVADPLLWIETISEYGCEVTASPDFGYRMCVDRYDANRLADCDLSELKIAINAADMVRADTLPLFLSRFGTHGFKKASMYPCYGLAEGTMFVCGGTYRTRHAPGERSADAPRLVGAGVPSPHVEVRIVDPETQMPLQPETIGEVWTRSASVAQ